MQEETKQPLINRRLATRAAILLLTVAALIFAYRWWLARGTDLNHFGSAKTAGYIAAVELDPQGGSQVVLITPGGQVRRSPGYTKGVTERDVVWRPDGMQLLFSSDRVITDAQRRAFNIFRWNLSNDQVEPRTDGTIAWSAPSYAGSADIEEERVFLAVAGGNVWERNVSELNGQKLMPFEPGKVSDNQDRQKQGGGSSEPESEALNIRRAKWTPDEAFIVGVRRTETGEALVVQPMNVPPQERRVSSIALGDRIEFDINPVNGQIAFITQGFQWGDPKDVPPEFKKNGRITKPFYHFVGIYDPANPSTPVPIGASKEPKIGFGAVSVSPDGKMIAVTAGSFTEDRSFEPRYMAIVPADRGPGAQPQPLAQGEIFEPSWSPNGDKIIYIKREGGRRNIYVINSDGSGEKLISDGSRSYATPIFSPQK